MRLTRFLLLLSALICRGDTGSIIPTGEDAPNSARLALESLDVHIVIDNGHATVAIREVFQNKTDSVLEGTYGLSLPGDATVSNFAVWDELTRIPGVILERKRAGELYNEIRNQAIDPGLLESGEVSDSAAPGQAAHSTGFTVKIVPIPPYGYKRIEAEYRQTVPLTQLKSDFVFPLKSSSGAVRVPQLSVSVEVRSAQEIASLEDLSSAAYPLKLEKQGGNAARGTFTGSNVELTADLQIRYSLANDKAPQLTSFRTGEPTEPGFFEASAILQTPTVQKSSYAAKSVLILFDTSLSMQWDKLERSFGALEGTLRSLSPSDDFNVIVFNSGATSFAPHPITASTDAIAKALDFVRQSRLRGGTDLQAALKLALSQTRANTYCVLLSDGEMTEGTIAPQKLSAWVDAQWAALAPVRRPHLYALAIGDDANTRFLQQITKHEGVYEQVNSTEPLAFKLAGFVSKLGLSPLTSVGLAVSPAVKPSLVYRLEREDYPGSRAAWVGQYEQPGNARITLTSGNAESAAREVITGKFANVDLQHPYLPVTWARARVDALLEKIDRDGEDKASIDEIIQLSRKYHFVTPYTSFLAAPRALLRPRLIRPGDPVLRVRTDPSIASVIALFPFGLTKPLRYLSREDMWQTRFLAPDDMADGPHTVRLILRDRDGHVFREEKAFVISSHPPALRVQLASARVRSGSTVQVRVQASQTTRTITAQLYGAEPLQLHWASGDKANTGVLEVPAGLPAGRYSVHVTAEDIAHNVSHQEVPLEVLP